MIRQQALPLPAPPLDPPEDEPRPPRSYEEEEHADWLERLRQRMRDPSATRYTSNEDTDA